MDGETIGALAITSYLSKELLSKLLGPTADYFGGELKSFAERRVANFGRILENAAGKSDNLDADGSVSPVVLRDILNDGSLREDNIAVEYFGGVLASAKTKVGRDDRAITITSTLSRLSTYQMRSHYIIYHCVRHAYLNKDINIHDSPGRIEATVYIPFYVYATAMAFDPVELKTWGTILQHSTFGLVREDLIEGKFHFGPKDYMEANGVYAPDPNGGILVSPSVLGAELFLRAHGNSSISTEEFFSEKLNIKTISGLDIPEGFRGPKEVPVDAVNPT